MQPLAQTHTHAFLAFSGTRNAFIWCWDCVFIILGVNDFIFGHPIEAVWLSGLRTLLPGFLYYICLLFFLFPSSVHCLVLWSAWASSVSAYRFNLFWQWLLLFADCAIDVRTSTPSLPSFRLVFPRGLAQRWWKNLVCRLYLQGHGANAMGGSLLAPKYDVMDLAASASRPVSRNPKKGNFWNHTPNMARHNWGALGASLSSVRFQFSPGAGAEAAVGVGIRNWESGESGAARWKLEHCSLHCRFRTSQRDRVQFLCLHSKQKT